jgi:hypothetical protein
VRRLLKLPLITWIGGVIGLRKSKEDLEEVQRAIEEIESQATEEKPAGKVRSLLQRLSSILNLLRARSEMRKAWNIQFLRERQLTCQLLELQVRSAWEEMGLYRETRLLYQAVRKRKNQSKYCV